MARCWFDFMKKRLLYALAAVSALLFAFSAPALASGYGGTDGNSVSQDTLVPSAPVSVRFSGFKPGSEVDLTFQSTPVYLGRFTADQTGTVLANVTVPKGTAIGDHHFVADGVDVNGASIHAEIPVRVEGASLAFTGANTGNTLALAGLLIVVGMAGMAAARRRLEPALDIDSLGGSPTRFRA
jgi:hypothetical protein